MFAKASVDRVLGSLGTQGTPGEGPGNPEVQFKYVFFRRELCLRKRTLRSTKQMLTTTQSWYVLYCIISGLVLREHENFVRGKISVHLRTLCSQKQVLTTTQSGCVLLVDWSKGDSVRGKIFVHLRILCSQKQVPTTTQSGYVTVCIDSGLV